MYKGDTMVWFSIIEDIANKFNGQIPNLIYFAIGIGLGIILFLITFFVVFIISKSKIKVDKEILDLKVDEGYKAIIEAKKDEFTSLHKNLSIQEKASAILKIVISMLEEISTLYYPNSNDPMFEVSIERLVDLIDYVIQRINLILDDMVVDRLRFIEVISKKKIKDIKLSTIFDLLSKKNEVNQIDTEKKGLFNKIKENLNKGIKKVGLSITGGIVNYTFYSLINDLGEDINKLYSNQPLVFTDISKKEEKIRKRSLRKTKKQSKEKVGDDYA